MADNNNVTAPLSAESAAPWGVGVELSGDYADLIKSNTISDNANFGILAFENPDPFPVTSDTIYFQISGNRFDGNRLTGNATRPGGADIGLEGGLLGSQQSVNNCFAGNSFTTSIPASIEGTWGCQNATTPNGDAGLITKVLALLDERNAATPVAQPAPKPQKTMPKPCKGVPSNALCG